MFIFLSQCNKKCTSFPQLGVGVCRRQAARGALWATGCYTSPISCKPTSWSRSGTGPARRSIPAARRLLSDHPAMRNLTAVYELIARAGLTHTRPPFAIDQRHRRQSRGRGARGGGARDAVRHAAALQEGHRDGAAARADGGAAERPLLDIAAGDRAHHAARPRCLYHRLAQCARRAADRRPVRLRRIYRSSDQVPRGDGAGHPRAGGVPALRRRARRRRRDGAGRQQGAAAQHDLDGRADRRARQSDHRRRTRQEAFHRMVREAR